MNIEKIFKSLEEDDQNSALGIIVAELENQGYVIKFNDKIIKSADVFEDLYTDLEKQISVNIELYKNDERYQGFCIEFIDFHNIVFKMST